MGKDPSDNPNRIPPANSSRQNKIPALVLGGPAFVTMQEAEGQRSFVESTTLPTDMDNDTRTALETFGVKFLGPVDGDKLFQYTELPKGWKKVASGHSMGTYLIDDKGRKRASIFYKAAFYDRSANISAIRRFRIDEDDEKEKEYLAVINVFDVEEIVFTTPPLPLPGSRYTRPTDFFATMDQAKEIARDWLFQNYPDWENPSAYWD